MISCTVGAHTWRIMAWKLSRDKVMYLVVTTIKCSVTDFLPNLKNRQQCFNYVRCSGIIRWGKFASLSFCLWLSSLFAIWVYNASAWFGADETEQSNNVLCRAGFSCHCAVFSSVPNGLNEAINSISKCNASDLVMITRLHCASFCWKIEWRF